MDSTAKEITFKDGVCSFCDVAQKELEALKQSPPLPTLKQPNKKYDCILGLSGGVDSSMVLHKAMDLGLRPLCFSVDNGWQDPKAQENIMRMVEKLKVPFYRYTIDIDKFNELQAAFIKAGVPNIEIPTDHILLATTYEMAAKNGIKWILSGGNVETESIMPASWGYNARDLVHIKAIYKKFIGKKLKGLPVCSLLKFNYYKWVKGIKMLYLLDYTNYNRANSIKLLEKEYGYQDYGAKHEESVFTKWHINFYLYEKFGFDKRKAHLSSLINSGQMTREEALKELEKNPEYPKLGIEGKVMKYTKHSHDDYPKDENLYNFICKVVRLLPKSWRS
jgi:7-cyano-7-deazaguanine synthase in queuosine biosynthesis